MKVVIDTNVLLNAIYPGSKNYWIRLTLMMRNSPTALLPLAPITWSPTIVISIL